MRKICCTKCKMHGEFKNPKISYICDKTLVFLVFVASVEVKVKKYSRKKN